MLAVLLYMVQRVVGILKDALPRVLPVRKRHANAQRDRRQPVGRVAQQVVDYIDFFL